jgi:predicted nuclease with RNAse H fold
MRVVGVDLAGSSRNETGVCVLDVEGESKHVATRIVHENDELLAVIGEFKPDLVAVDAPLTYNGVRRNCDELLRQYGALPVTLPGMEALAKRGSILARELETRKVPYIEVYSTATAKILGFYSKDEFSMQKSMMALSLDGDINVRLLTKDELDAVSAAMTAYLHLLGRTVLVGGDGGAVAVPSV